LEFDLGCEHLLWRLLGAGITKQGPALLELTGEATGASVPSQFEPLWIILLQMISHDISAAIP